MNFGKCIKEQCEQKKISRHKLSKLSGIPTTTIQNYMNGVQPTLEKADKLLQALKVSMVIGGICSNAEPEPKALALEELRGMFGLPVWIEDLSIPSCSRWHLVREENVNRPQIILIDARGSYNKLGDYEGCCYDASSGHGYGKTWLAYDREPKGE